MRLIRFLLPLLVLCLIAGAKKPEVFVRFHVEVNEVTGEPFMMTTTLPGTGQKVSLSKTAEISEQDIVAIYPFPADDGTIGCAFRLNTHGNIALTSLSTESRGATMVGFINSRAVTAMVIDRPINDALVVMDRGITPEELKLLLKVFPLLGQKKHTKGPKPAPAAATATATKPAAAGSPAAPMETLPSRD